MFGSKDTAAFLPILAYKAHFDLSTIYDISKMTIEVILSLTCQGITLGHIIFK